MSDIELPPNRGPRLLHPRELGALNADKGLKKFTPGDVVFFKRVKETSLSHGRYQEFKGHGFGLLIGSVPLEAPDPPGSFLIARMSQLGFVTFDDVAEILGKPTMDVLLEAVQKKYFSALPVIAPAPETST